MHSLSLCVCLPLGVLTYLDSIQMCANIQHMCIWIWNDYVRLCLFDDMHRVSSVECVCVCGPRIACSCHSSTSRRSFGASVAFVLQSATHGGVQYARPHDRLADARGQFINTFVLRMRTYARACAPAIRTRALSHSQLIYRIGTSAGERSALANLGGVYARKQRRVASSSSYGSICG